MNLFELVSGERHISEDPGRVTMRACAWSRSPWWPRPGLDLETAVATTLVLDDRSRRRGSLGPSAQGEPTRSSGAGILSGAPAGRAHRERDQLAARRY